MSIGRYLTLATDGLDPAAEGPRFGLKISHYPDGRLVVACGELDRCRTFLAWLSGERSGGPPPLLRCASTGVHAIEMRADGALTFHGPAA